MSLFAVVATVNDEETLKRFLAASPEIASGAIPLHVERDAARMSLAYNKGIDASEAPFLIFAHQDVYFPEGWFARLARKLDALAAQDPLWAVAGPIGVGLPEGVFGQVWCASNLGLIGAPAETPVRTQSLDELVLILRSDSGLRFDPELPHFHLYGTDIVQSALAAGRGAWIIDAPVVHGSKPVPSLGGGFTLAYRYMQKKWRAALPIRTPVVWLTRDGLSHLRQRFWVWRSRRARERAGLPLDFDPAKVAREAGLDRA